MCQTVYSFLPLNPAQPGINVNVTYCSLAQHIISIHRLLTEAVCNFMSKLREKMWMQTLSALYVSIHAIAATVAKISMVMLLVLTTKAPLFLDHSLSAMSCENQMHPADYG